MFNSKQSIRTESSVTSLNLIGAGTTIEGELKANGDIRVDGNVNGKVSSKAKVVLGDSAKISGDLHCQNADISGNIIGNLFIDDVLILKSTAVVNGDIFTGKLVIEAGSVFNGQCHMGELKIKHSIGEREAKLVNEG